MDQTINILLNVILNGGVIGSCGKLCSYLPNQVEVTVCNLLCSYVGIKEFIKLVRRYGLYGLSYGEKLIVTAWTLMALLCARP